MIYFKFNRPTKFSVHLEWMLRFLVIVNMSLPIFLIISLELEGLMTFDYPSYLIEIFFSKKEYFWQFFIDFGIMLYAINIFGSCYYSISILVEKKRFFIINKLIKYTSMLVIIIIMIAIMYFLNINNDLSIKIQTIY